MDDVVGVVIHSVVVAAVIDVITVIQIITVSAVTAMQGVFVFVLRILDCGEGVGSRCDGID